MKKCVQVKWEYKTDCRRMKDKKKGKVLFFSKKSKSSCKKV